MQHVYRSPDRTRDNMRRLVEAIARELWTLYGSIGGRVDWQGVERHLGGIAEQARNGARDSRAVLVIETAAVADAPGGASARDAIEAQGGWR